MIGTATTNDTTLRAQLAAERARAERAEQQLELERRTNAGLRGLAQMLITKLDRTLPVRADGPGDVW
jgi:hypothetical protein